MNETCAPNWEDMHRRIINLWDLMERFRLDKFIKAYQHASAMNQTWLIARDYQPDLRNVKISHGDYGELVDHLSDLQSQLEEAILYLPNPAANRCIQGGAKC